MQANVGSLSQANQKTAYVYWLHLKEHTDVFSEGYVGVTTREIEVRFKEHCRKAKSTSSSYSALHTVLNEYAIEDIIISRLCVCTAAQAYYIESIFRPFKNMGWNTSEGGKLPDSVRYRLNKH
jgi:hypothetical protein